MFSLVVLAGLLSAALAVPQTNCGRQAIQPNPATPRVVGGTQAKEGSWPWMGSLRRSSVFGTSHSCGGSVIDPWWFLTAAHCVAGSTVPSNYRIDLGMQHRDNSEPTRVQMRVSQVIPHPRYNSARIDEDVALMKFETPVTFNERIYPVCLPTRTVIDGEPTVITGWGNVQGTCCANQLKQALVPVVSRAQCTAPGWYTPSSITDNMICCGYQQGGTDTCQGDSGGPVNVNNAVNGTARWEVVGLTSWGQGCALANKPGVYTKVSQYIGWIRDQSGVEPPVF